MRVLFYLSLLILAGAGAVAWIGYDAFRTEFPDVAILRKAYPQVFYQGKNKPPKVGMTRKKPGNWVSLPEISRVAVGAVVVSEDWAFYQHKGYDPVQIKEAIKEDFEAGKYARGASTITQQVVKNVFLEREKNIWRKLKELILAVKLEDSVSKSRILEVYLNIAEWGEGIFGIGGAARHYFNKPASQLSAKEGAFLAMLLPSPKRYSQSFRQKRLTAYAQETVDAILEKMVKAQYLSEEQFQRELLIPLSFEIQPENEDSGMEAQGADPSFSGIHSQEAF
jgi:monofunctional glycosyltransferase